MSVSSQLTTKHPHTFDSKHDVRRRVGYGFGVLCNARSCCQRHARRTAASAGRHRSSFTAAQRGDRRGANSAAAERVFSMLKAMFGDQQMETLADIIQTALMLRINKRKVG